MPDLVFQHSHLEHVQSHKHLGLILSSDLGWSLHINNIVNNAYRRTGVLKKLKFVLGRSTLAKMYIAFIRPLLEYASDVWDGCTVFQVDLLEKVQLHAARIVTGLPIISSRESLYLETGWEPLSNRRETSKLTTMFKVHNNFAPAYVKDTFPSKRGTISNYNTRNTDDYTIPKCRLEVI